MSFNIIQKVSPCNSWQIDTNKEVSMKEGNDKHSWQLFKLLLYLPTLWVVCKQEFIRMY